MGVQSDANINSEIRAKTPFLCIFLQFHLGDDGEFLNEIINSPEKSEALLSNDQRKHFDYFKQGLDVASLDEDFYWNQPDDKHQSDGHEVPDVLNGAV